MNGPPTAGDDAGRSAGARDDRARRAAAEDLDRDLFLEAGAGTGKTTALVARMMALVRSGVALSDIAAITFTEKAAAELRERLRRDLVRASRRVASSDEAEILRRALDDLDGAAVCTLHSFAQRILREHTTEAGLPPRLEMLDEIGADMEFAETWERFVEAMLAEPPLERALVLGDALGMRVANLRAVARRMADDWDLTAERIPALDGLSEVPPLEFADLIVPMRELAAESRWHHDIPLDRLTEALPTEHDDLYRALVDLRRLAARLEAAGELEAVVLLEELARGPRPRGRKANWHPSFDKEAVRERLKELRAEAGARLDAAGRACSARLLARLAGFVLGEAERRRSQGRLVFHDLLVQARNLLRHPDRGAAVRRSLRRRYRRLLIDEFQDTDPIQVELALLIACDDPAGHPGEDAAEATGPPSWQDLEGGDGALFFVGDPKQSLYRFRRADIGLYLQVADWAGPEARETLSRNWRSSPAIVDWVNAVFGHLVQPADGSQPGYVSLQAARRPLEGETGAPVLLLGTDSLGGGESRGIPAEVLRGIEFAEVAALIRRAVTEGWPVRHGEATRPLRLSDVCVLIPARTVLGPLVGAFEAAGLPYRVESSSLVYATRAEGDLLATLRAIDDPSDHLAVVTALRSAAFGFGDDDLYDYRRLCGAHRPWDYLSPSPQPDHPVAGALEWMRELHTERLWRSPGEITDRVVRERRLLELAFAEDRHRDTWRRLRRAADQARAFSDSVGGTLRAYLGWVDMQRGEGARVVEALVPETDDDAVRIMTVHAAKGLEFPFVIVAGFSGTTGPSRGRRSSELAFPHSGGAFCKLGGRVRSFGSEAAAEAEALHEFHEDIRKLYVACTRAEDYLAVSLYRTGRKPPSWEDLAVAEALPKMTLAELLTHAVAEVVDPQPARDPAAPHPLTVALGVPEAGDDPEEEPASSPPGFAWALEMAGWTAGRPLETLQPGESPYGTAATDGSAGSGDRDPGGGRPGEDAPPGTTADAPAAPIPTRTEWEREHAALWGLAARRPVVAASAVGAATGGGAAAPGEPRAAAAERAGVADQQVPAVGGAPDPGFDKHEPEEDAPVWRRGRYGTALGRAVHAVLQTTDLDEPGQELAPQARRYATAEGVEHSAEDVATRARNALGAPVIREASRQRHWRELYAAAEVEGRLLEGFIDLLYEAADGSFVVVDYKTHASDERPDLRHKPGYRLQIAAYALMLEEATGRTVSRCVFVFLGPDSAHEVEVEDLPEAIDDVRQALADGEPRDDLAHRGIEGDRRWDDITSALGALPDTGHQWDEDPAGWVREQRRGDTPRSG